MRWELALSAPRPRPLTRRGGTCIWLKHNAYAHVLTRMDVSAYSCHAPSVPPKLPADPALGQAIRRLRERRGLTQEELATHAGMTFGTVSRLESAKSAPAWATVRALVTTLDCSLSDLAAEIETCEHTT